MLTLGIGVHYICAMTSPRCLRFASIRLRFVLFTEGTELFSFWVAADAAGKSRGFVAAGGQDTLDHGMTNTFRMTH